MYDASKPMRFGPMLTAMLLGTLLFCVLVGLLAMATGYVPVGVMMLVIAGLWWWTAIRNGSSEEQAA